jgi:hypothetical protein
VAWLRRGQHWLPALVLSDQGRPTGIRVVNISGQQVQIPGNTPVGYLVEKGHLPDGEICARAGSPRYSEWQTLIYENSLSRSACRRQDRLDHAHNQNLPPAVEKTVYPVPTRILSRGESLSASEPGSPPSSPTPVSTGSVYTIFAGRTEFPAQTTRYPAKRSAAPSESPQDPVQGASNPVRGVQDVQGVQGDQGVQDAQGAQGDQGVQGKTRQSPGVSSAPGPSPGYPSDSAPGASKMDPADKSPAKAQQGPQLRSGVATQAVLAHAGSTAAADHRSSHPAMTHGLQTKSGRIVQAGRAGPAGPVRPPRYKPNRSGVVMKVSFAHEESAPSPLRSSRAATREPNWSLS